MKKMGTINKRMSKRQRDKLQRSRRSFLKGLGSVALSAPLLSGLLTRVANAAEGAFPARFFLMFTGNGQHPDHWIPMGGETDFVMSPVLAPLEPLRSKTLLVHGFDGGRTHSVGMSGTTTGRPSHNGDGVATGGPSIDQFFADTWAGAAPLHSLELGVMPANANSDQTCYSASGLPIPPIGTSLGGFKRVFDVTNADPAVAEVRRAQKASVLDVFAQDLTALQGRLSVPSRVLLDEHLTLIRSQEQDLAKPFVPKTCDLHEGPTGTGMVQTWQDHNATIAAAFRCDATRVATLRAGGWGGIESGGYNEIGIDAGHHNAAHGGSDDYYNDLLGINLFHTQRLAELATLLDAVPEGDGTALDNSVLIWVNELGLGDFNHHSRTDAHVVMVGGGNLGMAQERFRVVSGTLWGHFLYTLTHLMGHTEVTGFGDDGSELVTELFA